MLCQGMVSVMSIGGDKRTDQTGQANKKSDGVRRISMVPTTDVCPGCICHIPPNQHVCMKLKSSEEQRRGATCRPLLAICGVGSFFCVWMA